MRVLLALILLLCLPTYAIGSEGNNAQDSGLETRGAAELANNILVFTKPFPARQFKMPISPDIPVEWKPEQLYYGSGWCISRAYASLRWLGIPHEEAVALVSYYPHAVIEVIEEGDDYFLTRAYGYEYRVKPPDCLIHHTLWLPSPGTSYTAGERSLVVQCQLSVFSDQAKLSYYKALNDGWLSDNDVSFLTDYYYSQHGTEMLPSTLEVDGQAYDVGFPAIFWSGDMIYPIMIVPLD